MKRTEREKRILNKLLINLDKWEQGGYGNERGFQLSIEEVISFFKIKYDEFPVMKRLITNPNYTPHRYGANLTTGFYVKYRWMK